VDGLLSALHSSSKVSITSAHKDRWDIYGEKSFVSLCCPPVFAGKGRSQELGSGFIGHYVRRGAAGRGLSISFVPSIHK